MKRWMVVAISLTVALLPSVALADGPVTVDLSEVEISLDGGAAVHRQIEYRSFLAERGATDQDKVVRGATARLNDLGISNLDLQAEFSPDLVTLRMDYLAPAAAHKRPDDYLLQFVLPDPLPVDPNLVVNQ